MVRTKAILVWNAGYDLVSGECMALESTENKRIKFGKFVERMDERRHSHFFDQLYKATKRNCRQYAPLMGARELD